VRITISHWYVAQFLHAVLICECSVNEIGIVHSKFLYPKRDSTSDAMSDDGDGSQGGNHDGKYELFAEVDNTVREEIKDLVFNGG